jgi:hypothetical protein
MKPARDSLMDEFSGHKTDVVGDVDCTAAGKPLCDANGVQGYPTIKHGDPAALEDYNGGRDLEELRKFTKDLKPVCSPSSLENCDEEGKAKIETVMALSDEDIAKQIEDGEKKISDAETTFNTELEKLQATYQELQKTKEDTIKSVKDSGLGLLKAVKAHKAKAPPSKEEL